MAIETYIRKPRGQKHDIKKFRLRIRTTVESTYDPEQRIPVNIDELYDTYGEAKKAEERHWLSIRTGELSIEMDKKLLRLSEPTMQALLQKYSDKENSLRAKSAQEVEKTRLVKTIPNTIVNLGMKAEERTQPGTLIANRCAPFGKVLVCACNKPVVLLWIEQRSKEVGPATVLRELGLISAAFDRFCDYWPDRTKIENPCKSIHKNEKPRLPQHRERVLSVEEEKVVLALADRIKNPSLALAIRVALGTAMRRGDIMNLDWSHINWASNIVNIPDDKASNAGSRRTGRKALIQATALDALKAAWESLNHPTAGNVIEMHIDALRSAWKRLQTKLETKHKITNLNFHDLRHTVITRAAESGWSAVQVKNSFDIADLEHLVERHFKDQPVQQAAKAIREGRSLTVEELAAISGHSDKSMLARYANIQPEDLAKWQAEEKKSKQGKIIVRQDGAEFVAIIGDVEARAPTAKAALEMAKELAEI